MYVWYATYITYTETNVYNIIEKFVKLIFIQFEIKILLNKQKYKHALYLLLEAKSNLQFSNGTLIIKMYKIQKISLYG